ncbi:cilia- and flagella-associated protein 99 [Plutella xylostella]|uniref:cilia- and flagella-associated protein 99 n=1 Tax=Plutella xylostella TaxID=51655 RepID=UPI0020329929|nr:cilia- and flagella-associated protein 99 [Plutella xylostella]
MVYYATSANAKIVRKLLFNFHKTTDITPSEFIKEYIENSNDESYKKLIWITETFLGVHKHSTFLKQVLDKSSKGMSEDEQDYFIIFVHNVIFQLNTKHMDAFYKCMFNCSKNLLKIITCFLGDKDVINKILKIAEISYDTEYVKENIEKTLLLWLPCMNSMERTFLKYEEDSKIRKLKQPTIPITPNVLARKRIEKSTEAPVKPDSIEPLIKPSNVIRKMLTKDKIDEKLKQSHEKNRINAEKLLNNVKNMNKHYTIDTSSNQISIKETEAPVFSSQECKSNRKSFSKKVSIPVKDTTLTIKRYKKRIQMEEQDELIWLDNLMKNCAGNANFYALVDKLRQERENQRIVEIEKKHLFGQLSYEEAIIAKKKVIEDNRIKYKEFLKEKQIWNEEVEKWKRLQEEKNKKIIEELSFNELKVLESKNNVSARNAEVAKKIKEESNTLRDEVLKLKNEELKRRVNMIKEIKIIASIAKQARVPKIIDLTESSGLGLLCEMSIAELQERLVAMKLSLNEELERKRQIIKENNIASKNDLESTKKIVSEYLQEKTETKRYDKLTKQMQEKAMKTNVSNSAEILQLKEILIEKRRLRIQMTRK